MNGPNNSPEEGTVTSHDIAKGETDTYDCKGRGEKEAIPLKDVRKHWDLRAQRPGIQAVMSARHSIDDNIRATDALKRDIFEFLEGFIEEKRVFELGFGIGRMMEELAERAREVVGIDISPVMYARAQENLAEFENVRLILGNINDVELPPKSFDLVFESIVLLHILDPKELKRTIQSMQNLGHRIFIVEHTYEGPEFPVSKYSILRKPEEYEALFAPYKLVKQKTHLCAGDRFTMMLFECPNE